MRLRLPDALKAIGALAALVALLLGVPAALAIGVGWPLPTVVPDAGEVRVALTSGAIDDRTILKAVALVIWVAWTQVALSAVSEVVAVRRRRSAKPAPLTLPGIQLVVGRLLSTVLLLSVLVQSRPTAPVAARLAVASVQAMPEASPAVAVAPSSATATWIVQPRETLWGIAERALGDGRRFQEIADLNRGRLQPDGAVFESPHMIRAGWVLQIPSGGAPAPGGPEHVVLPGESLSAIAEARLGDLDRWRELWELNQGRLQPDGGALTDPDLIEPGWMLRLPATGVAPYADVAPPAEHEDQLQTPPDPSPRPPTPPTSEPVQRAVEIDHDAADDETGLPMGVLLAGTAATGVLAILERRRRVAWRRRRRHEPVPVETEDAQLAERRLRAVARTGDGRLDAAVRAALSRGSSTIAFVAVSSDAVRLWPVGDESPPPMFEVDGDTWVTQASEDELRLAAGDGPSIAPALVPIGVTPDAELFVDLEQLGATSVSGPSDDVAGLLRALALTLEASGVRALTVGLGSGDSADWNAVVREIELHAAAIVRRTEASLRDARVEDAEGVEPLVVLGMSPPSDVEDRLAVPQAGVAALLGGSDVGHRLHLDETGRLHVPGMDHPMVAPTIDEHDAASIDRLLSIEVVEETGVAIDPLPDATPAFDLDLRDLPSVEGLLAGLDVLVRVFGPVQVVRLTPEGEEPVVLPRQKSVEAVTYLACRGRGVPVEDVRDALWPSGATSLKTLQNVVTDTRSALGTALDGEPLLPLPESGSYHLSDRVGSDHDVFQAIVRRAGELPDERVGDVAGLLADALGLVTGEPFVGAARGYAWVTHQRGALVAEVVDAAEELAEIRLAEGDWRAAEWAARQGLQAFPCDERLYRLLMRAAHQAGNMSAVQRVFDELCAVVADPDLGVEPDDTVHPDTLDLLEELLGSSRARAIGA